MDASAFRRRSSIWRKIAGWFCVLIGVAGMLLPLLPGLPFLFLGLFLLAPQYRWARDLSRWIKRRFRSNLDRRRKPRPIRNSPEQL